MPGKLPYCLHARIVWATTPISPAFTFFQPFLSYHLSTLDGEFSIWGPRPDHGVFRQPKTDWNAQDRLCLMGEKHGLHLCHIPASTRCIQEAWNPFLILLISVWASCFKRFQFWYPSVLPNADTCSISNTPSRTPVNDLLCYHYASPRIGGSSPQLCLFEGTIHEVFCLKYFMNQRMWILHNSPPLFSKECKVKGFKIPKTHSTLWFGSAQFLPRDPSQLLSLSFCPH